MAEQPVVDQPVADHPSAISRRIQQTLALTDPVSALRFVSSSRQRGLTRLGITTLYDLIRHYPFRYDDFSQVRSIALAPIGQKVSIIGSVYETTVRHVRARLSIVNVTLVDDSGMCLLSFFNQPWLAQQLKPGMKLICLGTMEHYRDYRQMSSPQYTILDDDGSSAGIQPVYRTNSDISQGWVKRFINEALTACQKVLDPLPPELRTRLGLMSRSSALHQVHHPETTVNYTQARQRLAFDEIFFLQLYLLKRKAVAQAGATAKALQPDNPKLHLLRAGLPFTLTADQTKATTEIFADLSQSLPMNRLLMGDVGSGKTIVALHALVAAAASARQAAMMAPTEVLAAQYATQLGLYLDKISLRWALLTSSTSVSERANLKAALARGDIDILFGTHALIEPDVVFADLALVVVDEQHRFGVAQREALRSKGEAVHYLAMTATPIPRSQALTIYGDLDVSEIRSRPNAHVSIQTTLLDRGQIGIAYDAVRAALLRGEQAYIVCPLIGQAGAGSGGAGSGGEAAGRSAAGGSSDAPAGSPMSNAAGDSIPPSNDYNDQDDQADELITEYSTWQENLRAARQEYEFLSRQVFTESRVALLTSRLPAAEKRQIMDDFRSGHIDVLVSTTVIEVGVDVANATIMVIMDADRFGLSQLHQLRGRVGRGDKEGQAFLVSASQSDQALERLKLLEQSSDGFELASADLRLRREGDVLGLRQHGHATLRLVQVIRDRQLIEVAHEEAKALLTRDSTLSLPEHALLAWELDLHTAKWQEPT
ncbi:MAG: ATP-dependent DNA helicase RecG [Coriobacteriia bacterium]|nr:ATP-dependent DNA helicase RecG [Coriobacteriia bacterium]